MSLASAWLPALLIASTAPAPLHSPPTQSPPTQATSTSAAALPASLSPARAHALDPAPDPEREYAKGKEKAQAAFLVGLEDFASWCQKEKCLASRNRAYEVVITIDPDHKLARKCLKYKRDRKTNEWTRKGKYKEPKAGKPEARAEAAERRAKVNEPYVDALMALLETHGELLKTSFVQEEFDTLLALAPEHAALRERLGYISVAGEDGGAQWLLEETQYAKTERVRIAGLLAELREEDPKITEGKLEDAETRWGVDWAKPVKSKKLRVVFDSEIEGGEAEARELIDNMNSAWGLFAELTGSKSKAPKAFTVYLLNGDPKVPGIIDACADFDDSDKEMYRGIYEYSDSMSLNASSIVCYRESAEHRLDTAVSEWVNFYLFSTYGVSFLSGWASVGMRHYVTEMILGTRMTMPDGVDTSPEMDRASREGKLPDGLPEARKVMAKATTRYLRDLIDYTTYSMSDDEIYASYALFAYVIEGHEPDISHKLLRKVARASTSRAAKGFEETLGMPIEVVQQRFTTWLEEIEDPAMIQASGKPSEAGAKKDKK